MNAKITKRTEKSMFFPDKEIVTLECIVDKEFDQEKLHEVKLQYKDGTILVYKLNFMGRAK